MTERYVAPHPSINNTRVGDTEIWPFNILYNQRTTLAFTSGQDLLEEGDKLEKVGKYFNYQSNTWERTGYLGWTGQEPLKETSKLYGWRKSGIQLTINNTLINGEITLYYNNVAGSIVGVIEPIFGEFTFYINNKIGGAPGANNHPLFDFDAVYDYGTVNLATKFYNDIINEGSFIDLTAPDTTFIIW